MAGRQRGRQPTISDVATRAGVSAATVSRVFNGKVSVDPVIAARVRESIRILGYAPSTAARSLSLGETRTIAVVVSDLENPMFHGVLKGVSIAAEADGFRVLVADTAEDATIEAETAREARQHCDAIILCAPRMPQDELDALVSELAPVIVVNRQVQHSPHVSIDYVAAIRQLVSEMVTQGHRSVGYLSGPSMSVSNAQRLVGIDEARRRYPGVRFVEMPGGSRIDDGFDAADRILESGVTSLIVFNDMAALGVLGAMEARGLTIPNDLSVAGIDDVPFAKVSHPPLTTISIPRLELGRQAWRRLKSLLDGTEPVNSVQIAPILVRRSSIGRPPATSARTSRLQVDGITVASYADGSDLEHTLARRPYLHPVMTLGGSNVTDAGPTDHAHHLGVSFAVPDVNGTSFWGGRTFVRGSGSTALSNHGTQRRDWFDSTPTSIQERLSWVDEHGTSLISERRDISARSAASGWVLDWRSTLTALTDISIGSPATNGREGAGYGGIFWRFPFGQARVFSEAGTKEDTVHGSPSPWLAVVDTSPSPAGSVLLMQSGECPWFVRSEEYVGAGPALAWSDRLEIPVGISRAIRLTALVLNRVIEDGADARELVDSLRLDARDLR